MVSDSSRFPATSPMDRTLMNLSVQALMRGHVALAALLLRVAGAMEQDGAGLPE
jgi:hypothetical protein